MSECAPVAMAKGAVKNIAKNLNRVVKRTVRLAGLVRSTAARDHEQESCTISDLFSSSEY